MNHKKTYTQFLSPPHITSIEGKEILTSCIRPLLSASFIYFKVSSFVNPNMNISVFFELYQCFKARVNVKLIIGIDNVYKLIPILSATNISYKETKCKTAVGKILDDNFNECEFLLNK